MNTFKVALTRTYIVKIRAENEENAKFLSEFYLGDCVDLSTEKEREEKKFYIEDLEMVYNEAHEVLHEEEEH